MDPLVSIIMPVYNQPEMVIRALNSIPQREDIEIVIVDDSTDETTENIRRWAEGKTSVRLIHHETRMGIGHAKNEAIENATGMYVHELDADDWLYTREYEQAMAALDGTDIVYISLKINSGAVFWVTEESQRGFCAGTARFIRREFLGDTRCDEVMCNEDFDFNERLQAKPHTDKFTRIVAYHYNFPREGSLYDMMIKGQIQP